MTSVGTFPRQEKRENTGAQIAVSICILLLPPILAFAVLAPQPHRSESGEAPHAREPLAESTSISVPITEENLHPPSLSRQLSGSDPPFEDRFAAALDYADDIDGHPSAIHEESPILPSSQLPTHGDRVQSVPAVRFLPRNFALNVSTCFPSASAVRQDHPEAWPSWTLRAAGHEGTKCWYPATRATVGDHRGETIAKKETPLGE